MIRCGRKLRLHPGFPTPPPWTAALVAVALLAAAGVGYRALARRLGRPSSCEPLPAGALAALPMELGRWRGVEAPLPEAVVRATGSDAHISRTYVCDGRSVGLYVAYGVQSRDLAPHRPEVCYPGAGWTLQDKRLLHVDVAGGPPLECTCYRFSRGRIDRRTTTVLNYYIVDGRYCPNVEEIRAKVWRGSEAVRYMAQVQIICASDAYAGDEAAESAVTAFARRAAGGIRTLFPDDDGRGG